MAVNWFKPVIITFMILTGVHAQDNAIPIQAEDADSIGSDYSIVTEDEVSYITPLTDFAATTYPGIPEKIVIFNITFPAAGTYEFYARVRVGADGYDDDSFYFASRFGEKVPNVDADWVRINNIDFGAVGSNEYVLSREDNSAGFGMFKWINASLKGAEGGTFFTVEEDSLTKTFMIGAPEDGFDIDKIAFGNSDIFNRISKLENGEAGVSEMPVATESCNIYNLLGQLVGTVVDEKKSSFL